jgi:hypothetical protein
MSYGMNYEGGRMTDSQIALLAKRYIDSSLKGQPTPSHDDYDAAVSKVEAETRKLLTLRRSATNQVVAVC